jgi:hypothetical protein
MALLSAFLMQCSDGLVVIYAFPTADYEALAVDRPDTHLDTALSGRLSIEMQRRKTPFESNVDLARDSRFERIVITRRTARRE